MKIGRREIECDIARRVPGEAGKTVKSTVTGWQTVKVTLWIWTLYISIRAVRDHYRPPREGHQWDKTRREQQDSSTRGG